MRDPTPVADPLAQARAAFGAGEWAAALAAAERALARAPGSVPVLLLALDSAIRADALARAVPWLESLHALHPGDPCFATLLDAARRAAGGGGPA